MEMVVDASGATRFTVSEETMLMLEGHRGVVCSLAYSPDGRLLASGGSDRTIRLWDRATGQASAVLKGHRTYVHSLSFSPDGRLLGCAAGDLTLRDLANGTVAIARAEPGRPLAGLSFAPDGKLLTTVDRRQGGANILIAGTVQFWDVAGASVALASGPSLPRRRGAAGILPVVSLLGVDAFLTNHNLGVWSLAHAPGGDLLAVGTDRGGVVLFACSTGQLKGTLETAAAVRCLAFTNDGRLLAAAEASRVQVWDVQKLLHVAELKGHQKPVSSLDFAPDSRGERATLFTGSQDGTVRVWSLDPLRERSVFTWPLGAVRTMAASPDGMTVAAAGEKGTIVIWDCEDR